MLTRPAILFVCLGNICRSPMAEGALRTAADRAGLNIRIDSCGTADYHVGKSPDPRAIATAARHGVDISTLRARQLAMSDFDEFTHIFALDEANLSAILAHRPENAAAHVSLLMDIVADYEGQPVQDPYYGGSEGFEQTWADVSAAAAVLAGQLSG